jgi:hypothetical protein
MGRHRSRVAQAATTLRCIESTNGGAKRYTASGIGGIDGIVVDRRGAGTASARSDGKCQSLVGQRRGALRVAPHKSSPTSVPIITDNYADVPGVNVCLGGGSVDTIPMPVSS